MPHTIVPDTRAPVSVAPPRRLTPRAWWLMAFFSFAIAGYALAYVVVGPAMYPPNLADSFRARPWGIYPHAFFGMTALALGPFQFRRNIALRRRELHRTLGKIY